MKVLNLDPKLLTQTLIKSFGVKNIDEETVQLCMEVGEQLAQGKMRIKDVLDISDEHIEMLYTVAYELYQQKRFAEAEKIFLQICAYDPLHLKSWRGALASQVLQNKYRETIMSCYSLMQIDPLKISYYLDMAKAFYGLKQIEPAIKCCEAVEFMAKEETFILENKDANECYQKAVSMHKFLTQKGKDNL